MKKIALILAIVLGVSASVYSQSNASNNGRGMFGRGIVSDEEYYGAGLARKGAFGNGSLPGLPTHNLHGDQPAPIGSGVAILTLLGAAYLVGKRRED